MIEQLIVKDYILFDYAQVNFNNGMSVITGETGAGKSLLIDAIGYLCGMRAPTNIVRKNKEKCILQLVLSKPNEEICQQLEEDGFEIEDELIIQRTVDMNGKSTIRLNMQATTLSYIKNLTLKCIDVHSQMDTYLLMNEKVQMTLLDQYAHTETLLEEVASLYKEYATYKDQLDKAMTQTFSDDELDYVTAMYNEIEQANVYENELEQLQEKIKLASSFQTNLEQFQDAIYKLDQDNGILNQMYSLYKLMSKSEILHEYANSIYDDYYKYENICEEIKRKKDTYQLDVEDLDSLQERAYFIKKLFRKHGGSFSSMMENKEKYLNRIDLILHRQDVFEKLEKKKEMAYKAYLQKAKELHEKRVSCFDELKTSIETHFEDLMLANAKFKIDCQQKAPSKDGIDKIEFLVSMNSGSPYTSLKKSASGGELSRLMLALKVVFQSQRGIDTIIFDEIDTGVSGKVAMAMASKMKALSKHYQVLCITHLASVACFADAHYCVKKSSEEQDTTTMVQQLNEEESIHELAIMATGNDSLSALQAAKELKERAIYG